MGGSAADSSIVPATQQVEDPPCSDTGSDTMIAECSPKHRSNVSRLYAWWTPARSRRQEADLRIGLRDELDQEPWGEPAEEIGEVREGLVAHERQMVDQRQAITSRGVPRSKIEARSRFIQPDAGLGLNRSSTSGKSRVSPPSRASG